MRLFAVPHYFTLSLMPSQAMYPTVVDLQLDLVNNHPMCRFSILLTFALLPLFTATAYSQQNMPPPAATCRFPITPEPRPGSAFAMPSTTAFPASSRSRPGSAACHLPASVPSRMALCFIATIARPPCPAPRAAAARGLPAPWDNGNATRRPPRSAWTVLMCSRPTTEPTPTKKIFSISARSPAPRGSTAPPLPARPTSLVRESAARISPSISMWRSMAQAPRPSVAQPTGFVAQPTTTTNSPSSSHPLHPLYPGLHGAKRTRLVHGRICGLWS